MNKDMADNIRILRSSRNMTQTELAERVGITKATISAYENGTRLPSYDVLIKIAQLFRVSTDNILGFSNRYSLDVSNLEPAQRATVIEIIKLYEYYNGSLGQSPETQLAYIKMLEDRDELE